MFNRKVQRQKRHLRLRQRIVGTAERPRMSICVTTTNMDVQFIDDDAGKTLASASSLKEKKANLEVAKTLGAAAAAAASACRLASSSAAILSASRRSISACCGAMCSVMDNVGNNIALIVFERYYRHSGIETSPRILTEVNFIVCSYLYTYLTLKNQYFSQI